MQYEIPYGRTLSANFNILFRLQVVDRHSSACFSNSSLSYEQQELEQVLSLMKIDVLKHIVERMQANVDGPGQKNTQLFNIFTLIDRFNEADHCPGTTFVLSQSDIRDARHRLPGNTSGLSADCVSALAPLALFLDSTQRHLTLAMSELAAMGSLVRTAE